MKKRVYVSAVLLISVFVSSILFSEKPTPQEWKKEHAFVKGITPMGCAYHVITSKGPPFIKEVDTVDPPVAGKAVTVQVEALKGQVTWNKKQELEIQQGKVFYSVDEGKTWQESALSRKTEDNNLWEGIIPGFPSGTQVLYYVWFQDEFENVATEVKPDFSGNSYVTYGDNKKFLFPSENEMVLTYEYKMYESMTMKKAVKEWVEYGPAFVLEKARILKTYFAQDEDYYYFMQEIVGNEKDVLGFYSFTGGVKACIRFYNVDDALVHPPGWDALIYPYNIAYWMLLPVDFYDTREQNCRLCIVRVYGAVPFFYLAIPEDYALFYGNKIYFRIEKGFAPGDNPSHLIKLRSEMCAESNSYPAGTWGRPTELSETSHSYVYLRTHSYEL